MKYISLLVTFFLITSATESFSVPPKRGKSGEHVTYSDRTHTKRNNKPIDSEQIIAYCCRNGSVSTPKLVRKYNKAIAHAQETGNIKLERELKMAKLVSLNRELERQHKPNIQAARQRLTFQ